VREAFEGKEEMEKGRGEGAVTRIYLIKQLKHQFLFCSLRLKKG